MHAVLCTARGFAHCVGRLGLPVRPRPTAAWDYGVRLGMGPEATGVCTCAVLSACALPITHMHHRLRGRCAAHWGLA